MANKFLTPLAYDPSQVSLLLGGWAPYGWASDTKIEVARAEDNVLPYLGCDNDLSLALNRNNSGTMTLHLQATSPSNDILAGMAAQAKSTRMLTFPLVLNDPAGMNIISTVAWIQRSPELSLGKEVGVNDWVLGMWNCEPTGNAATSVLNTIATLTSLSF